MFLECTRPKFLVNKKPGSRGGLTSVQNKQTLFQRRRTALTRLQRLCIFKSNRPAENERG